MEEGKKQDENIDWEQRRYEVAKDLMCSGIQGVCSAPTNVKIDKKVFVHNMFELSDEFIKELKMYHYGNSSNTREQDPGVSENR